MAQQQQPAGMYRSPGYGAGAQSAGYNQYQQQQGPGYQPQYQQPPRYNAPAYNGAPAYGQAVTYQSGPSGQVPPPGTAPVYSKV